MSLNVFILDEVTIDSCKAIGRALFAVKARLNLYDANYKSVNDQIWAHVGTYVDGTDWNKTLRECKRFSKAVRAGYMEAWGEQDND